MVGDLYFGVPMRQNLIAASLTLVLSAALVEAQGSPPVPPTPPIPAASPTPTAAATPTPPAPPAAITAAEVDRDAVIRLGRFVSAWANSGSIDSLITRADPAVGTPDAIREKLTSGLASFSDQLGGETRFSAERVMLVNGQVQYWRTAEYTAVPIPLVFRVMVGRDGKWRGFTVTQEEQLPVGAEEVKAP
jgi:hypothetical protein